MGIAAVVVHYQTLAETAACLRSLSASRRPIDRVIVVDNGSTPPFSDGEVIRSERNLGFAGGCNLGITRALAGEAEQILLLNSDAEVSPACVGQLEEALARRPDAGIVGPTILSGGRIESMGIRFNPRSGRMINLGAGQLDEKRPQELLEVEAAHGCCLLVRREVFERCGLLAEELFYGFEDLELGLRAARMGFRSLCRPDATVFHLGARSIGAQSPERLYFAARNHLRVAEVAAPGSASPARSLAIIGFNLAHAFVTSPAPRLAGVAAVARGVYDHYRRRYFNPR